MAQDEQSQAAEKAFLSLPAESIELDTARFPGDSLGGIYEKDHRRIDAEIS